MGNSSPWCPLLTRVLGREGREAVSLPISAREPRLRQRRSLQPAGASKPATGQSWDVGSFREAEQKMRLYGRRGAGGGAEKVRVFILSLSAPGV